jgi:CubicO group peptidase (beta-lactamase class C family)
VAAGHARSNGLGRRIAAAEALFRRQQAQGRFPGGQLAVQRGGELLLETAVGTARGFRSEEGVAAQPVTTGMRFQVMSVSKAVVAFAVALLEDRGLLDVAAPVARVWPEFAARGKGEITVLDVLTHRSGLLLEDLIRRPQLWSDWDAMVAAMADATPEHPRGTLSYEANAYGWVLAEVVRRVGGRPLPVFLGEELGKDLPGLDLRARDGDPPAARTYWLGAPKYPLGGINLADGFEQVNNEITCHKALVPGAGMLTTARDLAGFYAVLLAGGVAPSGRRLLREETLRRYITRQTSGRERITGAYVVLGRGFALGWPLPHLYGTWGSSKCFGHAGGFSCLGFGDPDSGLAVAILTNGNRSLFDMLRRFAPLSQRARRLTS